MPRYLILARYTPEARGEVHKTGYANRIAISRQTMESVGGSLESEYYMTGGEWDVTAIVNLTPEARFKIERLATIAGAERFLMYELFDGDQADRASRTKTRD